MAKKVNILVRVIRFFKGTFRDDVAGRLKRGYVTLILFMVVLTLVIMLRAYIHVPIQTILIILVILIMIIGKAKIQDLMAGLIMHPIMAMTAGFLIAGALGLAGGYDILLKGLSWLANLNVAGFAILGWVGVSVILANIPTIMPMPCGRIIGAALLLGVFLFGTALADSYGLGINSAARSIMISSLVAAFIMSAAASCGPSSLGGIGGIGEGNLGLPIGRSTLAQSAGILIATGIATVIIAIVVQPLSG
jgi:hypothetical protein